MLRLSYLPSRMSRYGTIFGFVLLAASFARVNAQRTQAPALKCNLPTILNTLCDNKVNSQQWFWDSVSGRCEKRAAGAVSCDGFSSRLECMHSCTCRQPLNTGSECPIVPSNSTASSFSTVKNETKTSMPTTEVRWWFESHSEKCEPFNFTGCDGNVNNFMNESACLGACQPPRGQIGARQFDLNKILQRQINRNIEEQNLRRAWVIVERDETTTEAPSTSSTTERVRERKIRVRERNETVVSIDQRLTPILRRPHKRVAIGVATARVN